MRIAIASGKGGTGKTTVAASLASVWDGPAIVADMDVEAPNLHLFVHPALSEEETVFLEVPRLEESLCIACGRCRDICRFKAIALFGKRLALFPDMCHGCGGCFAVCAQKALAPAQRELGMLQSGMALGQRFIMGRSRIGEAMTPPLLRAVLNRIEGMLEDAPADVLLDSPPGVSCPAMTVAREADVVLLVAEPTPFGFHDFRLAHQAVRELGKPVAVAVNRAGPGTAELAEYCGRHGLPILMELPFEPCAARTYARGELIAEASPAWRERFVTLASRLRDFSRKAKDA